MRWGSLTSSEGSNPSRSSTILFEVFFLVTSDKKLKQAVDDLFARGVLPVVDVEFDYLQSAYIERKPLFSHFQQLREAGTLPSLDSLSKEQLRHLWYIEVVPDRHIAQLFGVPLKAVRRRRQELGVTQLSCMVAQLEFGGKTLIAYPLPSA